MSDNPLKRAPRAVILNAMMRIQGRELNHLENDFIEVDQETGGKYRFMISHYLNKQEIENLSNSSEWEQLAPLDLGTIHYVVFRATEQ